MRKRFEQQAVWVRTRTLTLRIYGITSTKRGISTITAPSEHLMKSTICRGTISAAERLKMVYQVAFTVFMCHSVERSELIYSCVGIKLFNLKYILD